MIAFRNELFDGQLRRTLGHASYGGAELGECLAATSLIADGDRESWFLAWMALADRTHGAAEASLRAGHRESARTAFLRASNYYRNAYILHFEAPLSPALCSAHARHRSAFQSAAENMPGRFEKLAIPFEHLELPGYFHGIDAQVRPLIVVVGGYDSTAEECYFWNAAAALARGYHCMTFDGPGQGEMLIGNGVPFRRDWERVISAVVDAAVARSDVDANRIVLIGESWGGYLAPRAAAQDPRIAACVFDPAQIGLLRAMLARVPLPQRLKAKLPYHPHWLVSLLRWFVARAARKPTSGWALRRGMLTHGVSTPWDYVVEAAHYELGGLVEKIKCPTLICDAEDDDVSASSEEFYERLRCEKKYLPFITAEGAGEHCVSGNRVLFHERVFDWLDTRLAR